MNEDFQTGNLTFSRVTSGMFSSIGRFDSNMSNAITKVAENDDFTAQGLLRLQKVVQEWTVSVEMASGVLKSFGDVMKNILQKL